MFRRAFVIILAAPFLLSAQTKNNSDISLTGTLEKINPAPSIININNFLEVTNKGGHLQGIQYFNYMQNGFYILTGSSESYSYYSVVKIGNENNVISINKILDKPFKHAGGFQIFENLMVVGVEDNEARNQSKIYIYKIDNPENPPQKPIEIIERKGEFERVTAGCTAIISVKNLVLIIVGDWGAKHLDFYKIEKEKLGKDNGDFNLIYTIDTKSADRSNWSDNKWRSYQNINLIKDLSDNIYLAGLGSDENNLNVVDLYKVETEDFTTFNLRKIYTKGLEQNENSKFKWAAGIYFSDNNIKIFSSEQHLKKESKIYLYK